MFQFTTGSAIKMRAQKRSQPYTTLTMPSEPIPGASREHCRYDHHHHATRWMMAAMWRVGVGVDGKRGKWPSGIKELSQFYFWLLKIVLLDNFYGCTLSLLLYCVTVAAWVLGHYEDARIIWGGGGEGACFTSTLFPITAKDDKEEEVLGLQVIAFAKGAWPECLSTIFVTRRTTQKNHVFRLEEIIFVIIDSDSQIVLRTFLPLLFYRIKRIKSCPWDQNACCNIQSIINTNHWVPRNNTIISWQDAAPTQEISKLLSFLSWVVVVPIP